MAKACEVVGIELVDHMVVGAGGAFVSIKARGGW
jgi:DNA repair protein RadC